MEFFFFVVLIILFSSGYFYLKSEKKLAQEEENKLKELELTNQIKPEVEKFVKSCIDSDIEFPYAFAFKEEYLKAFRFTLSKNGFNIELEKLSDIVQKEINRQTLEIFDNSFKKYNPEVIDNKSLAVWLEAYLNTFGNNFEYVCEFSEITSHLRIGINESDKPAIYQEVYNFIKPIQEELNQEDNYYRSKNELEAYIKERANEIFEKEIIIEQKKNRRHLIIKALLKILIEEKSLIALSEDISNLMESNYKISTRTVSLNDIDKMDGIAFEHFLKDLFAKMGYECEITKASNDQGADLIAKKFGEKIVIQAKCYSSTVSNSAIQQVVAAKSHYNCNKAMVITNNYYTRSAIELALSNGVELWNREKLEENINTYKIPV